MLNKRNLFVALAVVIVISASIGFYELGHSRGEAAGYQKGFSNGFHSVLIQSYTMVDLAPNWTFLIVTLPFNANYVILDYSFYAVDPYIHNNTVEMYINAPGTPVLFSTGYHSNDTGCVKLSTPNINTLNIMFKANPNNTGTVVLDFNNPLYLIFN